MLEFRLPPDNYYIAIEQAFNKDLNEYDLAYILNASLNWISKLNYALSKCQKTLHLDNEEERLNVILKQWKDVRTRAQTAINDHHNGYQ